MSTAKVGSQLRPGWWVDRSAPGEVQDEPRPRTALHLPFVRRRTHAGADPGAAVLHGTAGLQFLGVMAHDAPGDWAAGDEIGPTSNSIGASCSAVTARVWGRNRRVVRAPRTAILAGNVSFTVRQEILARGQGLVDAGVEIIQARVPPSQVFFNPLSCLFPLTGTRLVTLGDLLDGTGGGNGVTLQATIPESIDPDGFAGGQTYFAIVGEERTALGARAFFTANNTSTPWGPSTRELLIDGYAFGVHRFYGPPGNSDPGLPTFAGCTLLGSNTYFDPGLSYTHYYATFMHDAGAAAEMATLRAWLPAFDRLRVAFWTDETRATLAGIGDDPAFINPGDVAAVVAGLDGGLNVVTYHPLPSSEADRAQALVDDMLAFFA